MALPLDWVKDIEDQSKAEDFEAYLRNNVRLFKKMNIILDEWEATLNRQERSKDQYSAANWDALQAHRNGNYETISKLRDLISFYK